MILGAEFKKLYKDPEKVQNNLKEIYDMSSLEDLREGKGWYECANSSSFQISSKSGLKLFQTSGIISAFSPSTRWEDNIRHAESFILYNTSSGHIRQQVSKANAILLADCPNEVSRILNGLKTVNFYHNINSPDDDRYVTIDRHMVNLATRIEGLIDPSPKQYHFLADQTIKFAKFVNLKPNQVQAILWVTWRKLKKDYDAYSKKETPYEEF